MAVHNNRFRKVNTDKTGAATQRDRSCKRDGIEWAPTKEPSVHSSKSHNYILLLNEVALYVFSTALVAELSRPTTAV
jgi:hypothetical protein